MKPICDICQSTMEFKERVPTEKKYRIRRYLCPGCGHQQTIYAGGYNDLIRGPAITLKIIEDKFKQESKNRQQ